MDAVKIITRSADETEFVGSRLGVILKSPASAKTVLLYGDLGTGKTTLIKGIASTFGIPKRDLCSASFIMVAGYETTPPFYHIDLYRLERPEDVEAVGVWEYIETGGIAVIEWAERLSDVPNNAIKVHIAQLSAEEREIIIYGVDPEMLTCNAEQRKSENEKLRS